MSVEFLHGIRWHHVVARVSVCLIIFRAVSLIGMRVYGTGELSLNIDQIIVVWLFLPWRLCLLGLLRLPPLLSGRSTIPSCGAPSVLILAIFLLFVLVHGNRGMYFFVFLTEFLRIPQPIL
jgi:hypothetical protein